jgi:hypothetical protein
MHPRSSNLLLTTAALIALSVTPVAGGPEGGTVGGQRRAARSVRVGKIARAP